MQELHFGDKKNVPLEEGLLERVHVLDVFRS